MAVDKIGEHIKFLKTNGKNRVDFENARVLEVIVEKYNNIHSQEILNKDDLEVEKNSLDYDNLKNYEREVLGARERFDDAINELNDLMPFENEKFERTIQIINDINQLEENFWFCFDEKPLRRDINRVNNNQQKKEELSNQGTSQGEDREEVGGKASTIRRRGALNGKKGEIQGNNSLNNNRAEHNEISKELSGLELAQVIQNKISDVMNQVDKYSKLINEMGDDELKGKIEELRYFNGFSGRGIQEQGLTEYANKLVDEVNFGLKKILNINRQNQSVEQADTRDNDDIEKMIDAMGTIIKPTKPVVSAYDKNRNYLTKLRGMFEEKSQFCVDSIEKLKRIKSYYEKSNVYGDKIDKIKRMLTFLEQMKNYLNTNIPELLNEYKKNNEKLKDTSSWQEAKDALSKIEFINKDINKTLEYLTACNRDLSSIENEYKGQTHNVNKGKGKKPISDEVDSSSEMNIKDKISYALNLVKNNRRLIDESGNSELNNNIEDLRECQEASEDFLQSENIKSYVEKKIDAIYSGVNTLKSLQINEMGTLTGPLKPVKNGGENSIPKGTRNNRLRGNGTTSARLYNSNPSNPSNVPVTNNVRDVSNSNSSTIASRSYDRAGLSGTNRTPSENPFIENRRTFGRSNGM
ncbi:MAG: hypothetical protein K6D38_11700 [Pseudobutyrivibrio sp.]|nr:hypothetical protein [Pseudobutyrivibrio sp.]